MRNCVGIVFATCAVALAGCSTTAPAAKWEKVVSSPVLPQGSGPQAMRAAQETLLNNLGKDGWVLVTRNESGVFYLKRPVR